MIRLLTEARSVLVPLPPVHSTKLFATPESDARLGATPSATPKMDRVRSVLSTDTVYTFLGPLDFLDSQSSIDSVFGSNPTILRLSPRDKSTGATEDTGYLADKL